MVRPVLSHEAVLYAFDLIEQDGKGLRDLLLLDRKRRLARLLGIQFVEHLTGDGATIFEHVCRIGLEGMVSKRWIVSIAADLEGMAQVEEPGERGGAPGA